MLLVMKFTFLLLIACLQVSAAGLAQTISLAEKNASLLSIFEAINRQTGYEFLYDADVLAGANPVDITVTNATLEEVLSICFKQQPLTYVISEKTIVVKQRENPVSIPTKIPPKIPITITGTVINNTGETMPGVNVIVKGTKLGTSTNADGKYSIDLLNGTLSGDEVLIFSFIGYKTTEVTLAGRKVIDVVLEEDITSLNEVQIIGTNYF
jgi:hypothetical protein